MCDIIIPYSFIVIEYEVSTLQLYLSESEVSALHLYVSEAEVSTLSFMSVSLK
jgi:hypothetical protein